MAVVLTVVLLSGAFSECFTSQSNEIERKYRQHASVSTKASSAYSQPASASTESRGAYSQPAAVYTEASGAYSQPASVSTEASGAYSQPASVSTETNGAYSQPASVSAETNGAYSQSVSVSTETSGAYSQPASASTQARGAYSQPASASTDTRGAYSQPASTSTEARGAYSQPASASTEASGAYSQPASASTETRGGYSQPASVSTETRGAYSQSASVSSETGDSYMQPASSQPPSNPAPKITRQPGRRHSLDGEGHYITPTTTLLSAPITQLIFVSTVFNQNSTADGDSNVRAGDNNALANTAHGNTATAITHPVTAITPPMTAVTPSVTATTPQVTAITHPMTVSKPLLTAITPPVTAIMPSVTAIPLPWTATTLPLTANTPPVTANTSSETSHIRGVSTHVDGDRVVFEVNSDYLPDCNKRAEDREKKDIPVFLNRNSTSYFKRGTLKINFRWDNAALNSNPFCRMFIKTRIRRYILIKILHLKMLPVDNLQVAFEESQGMVWFYNSNRKNSFELTLTSSDMPEKNRYWPLNRNLDRPRMSLYKSDMIDLRFAWHLNQRFVNFAGSWKPINPHAEDPPTFSMELQYTEIESWEEHALDVTWTSAVQGFVKSPFWDGFTEFRTRRDGRYQARLETPEGHHTMISWEHIGLSDSADCSGFKVKMDVQNGPTYAYCSGTTPSPRLLHTDSLGVVVLFPTSAFTGVSMRFSFHNASALPRQLENEMWDCSVPHWPDFKQHLLCDMLTECARDEDEADCPYSDGTCPNGYLAAGGSCFVFDIPPKALTSWTEAGDLCRRRGARLPTLNTPDKWQAVLDLLSHRGWEKIYIGLTVGDPSLPDLYNHCLQWSDSSVAYYMKAVYAVRSKCYTCAFLRKDKLPDFVYLDSCSNKVAGNLLCEVEESSSHHAIHLATENKPHSQINATRCPKGHVTHNFLSCDPRSDCFLNCQSPSSAFLTSVPPAFKCHNGFERVPFTLVCDHREDCSDASDEICVFPQCREFECKNKQCITGNNRCNGVNDCLDGSDETSDRSDETQCRYALINFPIVNFSQPLPAMVLHDGKGEYVLLDIADHSAQSKSSQTRSSVEVCPDTHFQCPGISYYCLPVYVRCNGVRDCPGHEDENDCDISKCPGFYRCRRSKICIHNDHLCDGIFHCPQRDDELMCGFVCPAGCTCYGMAFYCAVPFDASRHVGLRFLVASRSGMNLQGLSSNAMLFYLSLSMCNITRFETKNCFNVFHLDLSKNSITTVAENLISSCQNLQVLVLAGNPLRTILENSSPVRGASFSKLHTLDLSAVSMTAAIMVMNLSMFSHVRELNLSYTGLDAVSAFHVFSRLQVVDLRGCPVTYFTRSTFQGLDDLSTVYADNYKLCCPETLPDGFAVLNCHAPFDEVSSCEGLLKSGLYRVSFSFLTFVILLGNAGSFLYRVVMNRPKQQSSINLFVTHLCVSDFLMGLYSAIIGVADRLYLGHYVWKDVTWRRSVTCQIAGVLSLMSSEVSVLIICLITVDRFLVTRFPLSPQLHFSLRSAHAACVTAWSVSLLLAVTPLLPVTSHWQFYSQSGICIPLPVTRQWFAGRQYSFGILIILKFVLFLVITSGQISIYLSVRANILATLDSTQKAKDLILARRLMSIAVFDTLCWLPVGVLGVFSSIDQPISSEASVIIAVFVLPLNSALNPFLYTVNVILERRQRAREQRLQKIILFRARFSGATAQ